MAIKRNLDWNEIDDQAVDTIRVLAMDAVQKVGNGHPGTAMSLAPAAYLLFQKVMRHNPADPHWPGRDRFVLSCGHSSLTLYIQLFLGGWGLELEDLKALRTWGSKTPGHPEYGHTAGVETTTGPLGQGIGNAVGMAMAARREHGLLDPNVAEGESLFDHQIYALASDGDIEEGVSSEASSLAGTQKLGNLTLIYDMNQISIEDDTDVALSEDTAKRYEAYGWHVQVVDWRAGSSYKEDVPALYKALQAAERATDQPSLIVLRTIIAWPAPNAQNTGKAHGSALGDDEVAATKRVLGWDPDRTFEVPEAVLEHTRQLVERGKKEQAEWEGQLEVWSHKPSADLALYERLQTRTLPEGWDGDLPTWPADDKGVATRKASGAVINALASRIPELWGGSADLAESNNSTIEDAPSFIPKDRATKMWKADPLAGRVLHFGIREHAMGSILNGVAAHGGTRVFGATFLTFSDYMRPAVRLAALMKLPVTYVWTHDSIGLGEDGPTHQPVEHLAALRAIPGLDVVRPADANETAAAWRAVLTKNDRPGRHDPHPPERAHLPARRGGLQRHQQRPPGRLRAGRHRGWAARRRARGHRLGGAAGRPRPRDPGRAGRPRPRGVDAVPRVVRRAGGLLQGDRHPADREGPGLGRGRDRPGLARGRGRPRPDRLAGALRRFGRVRADLPRVRDHRRGSGRGGRGQHPGGDGLKPGSAVRLTSIYAGGTND